VLEFSIIHKTFLPIKKQLLVIKVRLDNEVKTIEISNYDSIYAKAFHFCYENSLSYQFITPIYYQVIKAMDYLSTLMNSEVDTEKMESIREIQIKQ
jgi:hypothetical protein